MPQKTQLQYIQDFLIELAAGNFSSKITILNEDDEQSQAVKTGINMLVEELRSTIISRVFLNSIYNGINDILIVVDLQGEIKKVNQVLENTLGYSERELLKKPIDALIQKNDRDNVKLCISNALNLAKIQEVGLNFKTKENIIIPVSCSFSALIDHDHQTSGVLLVAKNISALLNARDQLRAKNDELNLFVYKASHDLKSPVNSMMGLMSLIKKSNDSNEIKQYHHMMDKTISSLDTVLNELLIIGRITYGELELKPIDVREMIENILDSIESFKDNKKIKINCHIDDSIQFIHTEKGLFQSILFNLIDNAIKYQNKYSFAPYLNITITSYQNGIRIIFEDNGIGIEDIYQPNIFKMFYRANEISQGTGLGLYIVKTSITKLGGEITFKSVIGKGTAFKIYLPCEIS